MFMNLCLSNGTLSILVQKLTSEECALELVSVENSDAVACGDDEASIVLVEVHGVNLFVILSSFH